MIGAVMTRIDEGGGSYDFTSVDTPTNAAIACGVTPSVRVFTLPSTDDDRGLPADLDAYRAFIVALVDHMRGRITRYGIENEVISTNHWGDTPADYFKLVGIASGAIHQTDPNAIVLDSVGSAGGFSIILARKLMSAGDLNGALAVIQESQDNELGGGTRLTDVSQVTPYLTNTKVLKMQDFYDQLIANKGLIDALQMHYYGPASSLPTYIDMVRADGLTMPIEIWELGHRFKTRPFDPVDQSNETTRLLATATGEGSRWNVLQRYDDKSENWMYGLLDPSGNSRPARFAYRTAVRMLTGVTSTSDLALPGGATGYRYSNGKSWRDGVWTTGASVPVGSKLGISATTALVTNNEGSSATHVRLGSIQATPSPLWVEPDLLEVKQLSSTHRGLSRIRVTCPTGSATPYCQGKLKILGGKGNRKLIGERRFKVGRGVTRETEVKKKMSKKLRGTRARIIIATPYKCSGGLKTCRSWQNL